MIHTTDAPLFANKKPSKTPDPREKERRHSWATADEEEIPSPKMERRVSAELTSALWGRTLQAFSERILPTGTVGEALEIFLDSASRNISSDPRRKITPSSQSTLKLIEAHIADESAKLICACINHQSPTLEQKVLLIRRDGTYDLALTFDREVEPELDQIDIVLELTNQLLTISGLNVVTIPVALNLRGQSTVENSQHWWARLISLGEKTIIRFHVSHSARIGKWRMKVVTQIKQSDESPKKNASNSCPAFQCLHITMSPDQMGRKKSEPGSPNRKSLAAIRRLSKEL